MATTWTCKSCCAQTAHPYRYPPSPDVYCADCGNALTTNERGVETLRGLLAVLEQRGLPLPTPTRAAPAEASAGASNSPLLTVEEVAQLLRTTPKGVYAKVARSQLPGAIRVGRALRFRRSDVVKLLSEGRAPSSRR